MKNHNYIVRVPLLMSFLICLGFVSSRAQSFEGVIHYQFPGTAGEGPTEIAYMIKDSKVRMQFNQQGQSGAMLYLPSESEMVIIIDQMKSYMKMDMDKQAGKKYDGKWSGSQMQKTGQTKTLAGHSCEVWVVENSSGDQLQMCMAEGLGTFMSPGNPMARQQAPAWARKIVKEGYMPLEVIQQENGKKTIQMKVTKIESRPLDAALFTIPEGYRDMSAMMQQMQNRQR